MLYSSTQKRIRKSRHQRRLNNQKVMLPLGLVRQMPDYGDEAFKSFLKDTEQYPDATPIRIYKKGIMEVMRVTEERHADTTDRPGNGQELCQGLEDRRNDSTAG